MLEYIPAPIGRIRHRRIFFDEVGLPAAQIIAAPLTQGVLYPRRTTKRPREQFLGEAAQEMTGVTAGVCLQEEKRPTLDDERTSAEATDRSTEQSLEQLTSVAPCRTVPQPFRQTPYPARRALALDEKSANTAKDLRAIRPANDESKQAADLIVGQADASFDVFPVRADLPLHDVTQPEPARNRLRRIFVLQDLHREIHISHHFEQTQGDHGLNPAWAD